MGRRTAAVEPCHRRAGRAGRLALAIATAGCAAKEPAVPETVVEGAVTIISTESALLEGPVDVAVDDRGHLYVLDHAAARVIVTSADGAPIRTIGRPGGGPAELRRPASLQVSGDTLRIADPGNARLLTLTLAGEPVRETRLPPSASMGPVAIGSDGSVVVGTLGLNGSLAAHHDPTGALTRRLGRARDSVRPIVDPEEIRADLLAGRVPAFFRNAVLPVFAPDGGTWLVLTSEGTLERHGADGSRTLAIPLEAPEMAAVWDEIVALAKAPPAEQRMMPALSYVRDAAVVGRTLWLLLNTTRDGAAVLAVVDEVGRVTRRLRFPGVVGAGSFAVDAPRRWVYFALPGTASVIGAPLPSDPAVIGRP